MATTTSMIYLCVAKYVNESSAGIYIIPPTIASFMFVENIVPKPPINTASQHTIYKAIFIFGPFGYMSELFHIVVWLSRLKIGAR